MNTREVVHVLNMACFSRALFIRPSAGCRRGPPPSTPPPPPPPPPSFSWGSVFLSLSLSLPFSMNGKGHICHSPLPFTGRKEEGKGRRRGQTRIARLRELLFSTSVCVACRESGSILSIFKNPKESGSISERPERISRMNE